MSQSPRQSLISGAKIRLSRVTKVERLTERLYHEHTVDAMDAMDAMDTMDAMLRAGHHINNRKEV